MKLPPPVRSVASQPAVSGRSRWLRRVGATLSVALAATVAWAAPELLVQDYGSPSAGAIYRFSASGTQLTGMGVANEGMWGLSVCGGRQIYASTDLMGYDDVHCFDRAGHDLGAVAAQEYGGYSSVVRGPDGNLYVSATLVPFDTSQNPSRQVLRLDGPTPTVFIPSGTGGMSHPNQLRFGPDGKLYISDRNLGVLRFDPATGAYLDTFVPLGRGGLSEVGMMVFGPDHQLYIASPADNNVRRYDPTGAFVDSFVTSASGGLSKPRGLAFGADGSLFVASSGTHQVLQYNGTTGAFVQVFTTLPQTANLGELAFIDGTPHDAVWFDDGLPAGAVATSDGSWAWGPGTGTYDQPTPYAGANRLQLTGDHGTHTYRFDSATRTMHVNAGDSLYLYVNIGYGSEVMVSWFDGTWEHRAYWGANTFADGTNGTASRRYQGPMPRASAQWTRLEVPAAVLGLEGSTISGLAITTNGHLAVDRVGVTSETVPDGTPQMTSASTLTATAGQPFQFQITATGTPTTFYPNQLPGGLTLDRATGVISGTPVWQSYTEAPQKIALTIMSGTGTTETFISLAIPQGPGRPTITSDLTVNAIRNQPLSYQITATNSPTGFNINVPIANWPAGVSVDPSAGTLSGSPQSTGTWTFQISARNGSGSDTKTLTLNVSDAPPPPVPVTSNGNVNATVGVPFQYQIQATASPTSYDAPARPAWLALDTTTGVLSGTPTAAGDVSFPIYAYNANGNGSATLSVHVTAAPKPVLTDTSANGTVGTAFRFNIAASNAPTAYDAQDLPPGLAVDRTTGVISGTPTQSGTWDVTLQAVNATGTGAALLHLTIAAAPVTVTTPVLTDATANGTVGSAFTFAITAANTPTSFEAQGLPAGLAIDRATGRISGTPAADGTFRVTLQASNAGGTGSAVLTLTIAAATPPPPPAPPPLPPPPSPAAQTVSFVSPVSSIIIGQPVLLSATASSGLPVTFSVVSGSASISGNALTPTGPGEIIVKAVQAGDATHAAASTTVSLGAPTKAAQVIPAPTMGDKLTTDGTITLAATSSSGLPLTYTVVSGPATVSGNTLTLNGASGTVVVRVSQPGDDRYSAAQDVTLSFQVNSAGPQVYFGRIGSDDLVMVIAADGRSGTLLTRSTATGLAYVGAFTIAADGSFSLVAAPYGADTSAARSFAGRVADGTVTGQADGSAAFTAAVQPANGVAASLAGLYTGAIPGSADGVAYLVVAPGGRTYALSVNGATTLTGFGSADGTGAAAVTAGIGSVSATIDPTTHAFSGQVTTSAATADFAGLRTTAAPTDRLVNLSTRLSVTAGDGTTSGVVGFVVAGTAPKQLLVRAVGPGLKPFGVANVVTDPILTLFDSAGVRIGQNSGWNNDAAVAAAAKASGAFALAAGSSDAALLITLPPGNYTAQVSSATTSGEALVEVYDVTAVAAPSPNPLINLSARGYVAGATGVLTGGFVVSGNQPKRVLIRGVGPALTPLGVSGALADPVLTVYDANGAVVARNDNWATAQAVSPGQVAATAAGIRAADTRAGAFALADGSRDAAVVITLAPGAYTATVRGGGSGGVALVEVYELASF